jgi:hypothetical protein
MNARVKITPGPATLIVFWGTIGILGIIVAKAIGIMIGIPPETMKLIILIGIIVGIMIAVDYFFWRDLYREEMTYKEHFIKRFVKTEIIEDE